MVARAPKTIRMILQRALRRAKDGPCSPRQYHESDEHMEGRREQARRESVWRDIWIRGDLEAVLNYLEGNITVADIESGRVHVMDGIPLWEDE